MNVKKNLETPAERFLEALAAIELRDGVPMRQTAMRLRMDPSTLSHYRAGRTARVSRRVLIDAERQLGISLDWIETGAGAMFREGGPSASGGEAGAGGGGGEAEAPADPRVEPLQEAVLALRELVEMQRAELARLRAALSSAEEALRRPSSPAARPGGSAGRAGPADRPR